MTPDPSAPLRLYDPQAESYSEWSERLAKLREELRDLWKTNREQQAEPWNGIERRAQAR
jgi:hypothetical protein